MKFPFDTNVGNYTDRQSEASDSRIRFLELKKDESAFQTVSSNLFLYQFVEDHKSSARDVLTEISNSASSDLAGVVVDMFCASMIDVANEFGVPSYVFYTSGAAVLGLVLHLQSLRDDFGEDVTNYENSKVELAVPTYINPVPVKVLPSRLFDKEGGGNMLLNFSKRLSGGCFDGGQVKEIACAVERSGYRFLWSLRKPPPKGKFESPGDYENLEEALPEGFLQRTAEVGKVIGWAPQAAISSHPAVGCFVSHCGWNSTLESVWYGVPMATWPLFAEQQVNAFLMLKDLGMAVEINMDFKNTFFAPSTETVAADLIEKTIKHLMDPENEIRKKVKEKKEKSRLSVSEGGPSSASLGCFLNALIDNIP